MIGKTISHYKIVEKLGEGGMGVVYKAEDTKLKRTVALKFLPPELTRDPEAKIRFIREAQAASALEHPNICNIHEINESDDGQLYIVMACYEGRTLKEKIKQKSLKTEEAINIAIQIAEGLERAHEQGIVHCDIKPANIIITDRGEVKILDFGLAKLAGKAQLTKDSSTLGTVAYMSPEQLSGKEIDQRTDIWSLGVILYEMLTGELPFKGEYEQAVIYSILNEEINLSQKSQMNIPDELINMIYRCMQKNPADRYQSIQEFSEKIIKYKEVKKVKKSSKNELLSKRNVTIMAVLLAILTFVFIFIFIQPEEKKVFDSIAVLPLKNLSGNPDQEYFADGMTEALITELSRLKSLKVISRTSVMQFKESNKTLPDIAEELNVSVLVEGSALIIGDQVKITAQLIDAEQDQHLWAEDYVRDLRDILLLHKELARTIALQVKATLLPEEKLAFSEVKKVNPTAYESYLKGKFYLYKFTKSDVDKAVQFFNSALEQQNDFALAYAALAEAYNIMSTFGWISSKSGWVKNKEMTLKALEIDNSLAEAHTMLADVKYIYEWDWGGAEIEFKKAIEINPNYSTGHGWYATFLSAMGRHEEAIAEVKIAQELDPRFFRAKVTAANVYMFAGQYENAEKQLLQLIHLNTAVPLAHNRLGKLYLISGRFEEAILNFEKFCVLAKDSTCVPRLAQAYALNGNIIKARQLLDYWLNSKQENIQAAEVTLIYLSLGDMEKTFEWLQKAYDYFDDYLFRLKVDPSYDPIRNDQRYIELLNKIGLNP